MKKSVLLIVYCLICIIVIFNAFFAMNQKTFSKIENRELMTKSQFVKEVSADNFAKGATQNNLNSLISDQFPLKENMLDINLKLEHNKSTIVSLFSPDLLVKEGIYYRIGGTDYYMDYPLYRNETDEGLFSNRIWNFERISEKYGDKYKLYIYKPTESEEKPWFNSDNLECCGDEYWTIFNEILGDKYTIKEEEMHSLNDYMRLHYKTDHHWNHLGSYIGYCDIINMIGEDFDIPKPYPIKEVKEYSEPFYGSLSLKAMNTLGYDDFIVNILDVDNKFRVFVNGEERNYGMGEDVFKNPENIGYLYEEYFGGNEMSVTYENLTMEDGPNILIFGDSFSNVLKKDIANHFKTTYFIDTRRWITREDPSNTYFSLDDFLVANDVDCILWLQFYTSLYFDSTCYLPIDLHY